MLAKLLQKTLPLMPASLAFPLMKTAAQIPARRPLSTRDLQALSNAEPIFWKGAGQSRPKNKGWRWNAESGEPRILLVHGWGGRAAQMAALGSHLAWLGFDVIAIDVTAHGESPGRQMQFRYFIDDITAISEQMTEQDGQPWRAVIAHSAGGMTAMAARFMGRLQAESYVGLNSPLYPYPPLETLDKLLKPPAMLASMWKQHVEKQFPCQYPEMLSGTLYRNDSAVPLLLINDRQDDQVRVEDQQAIQALWPDVALEVTDGLGHNGVLWDDAVHVKVGDFVAGLSGQPSKSEVVH